MEKSAKRKLPLLLRGIQWKKWVTTRTAFFENFMKSSHTMEEKKSPYKNEC
jgi:hypothetical protein